VTAGKPPRVQHQAVIACPYCLEQGKLRGLRYEAAPDWWICPRCAGRMAQQLLEMLGLVV
jgi:hypothetical protein